MSIKQVSDAAVGGSVEESDQETGLIFADLVAEIDPESSRHEA